MDYDVYKIRQKFPVTKTLLYLDSGLQNPLSLDVKEGFDIFFEESLTLAGPKAVWIQRLEKVRKDVADFFGVKATEIAFTKNTSDSVNIFVNAYPFKAGDNVIMIHGDHPNNTYAFLNLIKRGVDIKFIPMTEVINADSFKDVIDENTKVISVSHVTFHAGHKFDIQSIAEFCNEKGIHLLVDAMQSVGVMPLNLKKLGISAMACGSHKGLLVPQGLGILYVSEDIIEKLEPVSLAIASIENFSPDLIATADRMMLKPNAGRFEIGNFNLPTIAGLEKALELINSIGVENLEQYYFSLGDLLISHLDRLGISLVGPRNRNDRAPHIYVIGLDANEWIPYFESKNIRVSPERDGVRISFSMFNTEDDVQQLVTAIEQKIKAQPNAEVS